MTEKTIYQRMLEDRFYLYRPWIPICKSIEAETIRNMELAHPVLDIGCGNGLFASYCFRDKIDVGLDCDEKAIEGARKRSVYKTLEVGDACDLPFADESFNTVISVCAVEHIPRLDKVLINAYRVLKKGGKFIFTVPSEQFGAQLFGSWLLRSIGLQKKALLYGAKKNKRSGHIHIYPPLSWKKMLEEKGFSAESVDYIFPGTAVTLWSFLHSLPFRIIFLPFRIFRDLNIKFIDKLLKSILDKLFSKRLRAYSKAGKEIGGYLLIVAIK